MLPPHPGRAAGAAACTTSPRARRQQACGAGQAPRLGRPRSLASVGRTPRVAPQLARRPWAPHQRPLARLARDRRRRYPAHLFYHLAGGARAGNAGAGRTCDPVRSRQRSSPAPSLRPKAAQVMAREHSARRSDRLLRSAPCLDRPRAYGSHGRTSPSAAQRFPRGSPAAQRRLRPYLPGL